MITEDDTFNVLRKTPILDMMDKVIDFNKGEHKLEKRASNIFELLRLNGWTKEDYNREMAIHWNEYCESKKYLW